MVGFLNGIRVLDFGQFIAGPYCANLLGSLGADVIRIERIDGASDRALVSLREDGTGDGALYSCINTFKRSLAIDLLSEEGKAITRRLLEKADIVVANLPTVMLEQLGLTPGQIKAVNPRTVLVTCSAYGPLDPTGAKLGFDGIAQALSGAMHMTGDATGPRKAFVHYVDYFTAVISAFGAIAALREVENGRACGHVETSLIGSAIAMMAGTLAEEAALHPGRQGSGNKAQTAAPANTYRTQDGHVIAQIIGNSMFRRWARMLEHPEWLEDPRFGSDEKRATHGEIIDKAASTWFAERSTASAIEQMNAANLPAAPVLSPAQIVADKEFVASDLFEPVATTDDASMIPASRIPIAFAGMARSVQSRSPRLGEHSFAVLTEAGYEPHRIDKWIAQGAIVDRKEL